MKENIDTLVDQVKIGNIRAYAVVVGRFQSMALTYAYSILGDYQQAEDVVQEAFVKAFECISQLSNPAAFPGWFRRILFTCCDRVIRQRKLATVPLNDIKDYASHELRPDEITESRERIVKIRSIINTLPEAERTVVNLYYLSGFTQTEIGTFLEIPSKTVKSRLHTARKKLKQKMLAVFEDLFSADIPERDQKEDTRMLKAIYPELSVSDVEASASFLEDALDFKRRFPNSENGELHFVVMSQGNISLFLHKRVSSSKEANAPKWTRIYFEPADIRKVHSNLRQKGYDISDLEEHENGTVCHLRGPDGYEFWFQQWNA